jgi:hypothetical protein
MGLEAAAVGAEATAAATGFLLARRRASQWPAALALLVILGAKLARIPVYAALVPLPTPIQGAAGRALLGADGALYLLPAAVLAGLPLWLASEHPRRVLAGVVATWTLVCAALIALYPSPLVRGEGRARVYLAVDLLSLFVAIVALVRRATHSHRSPGSAELVALALILMDVALVLTPLSP